MKILTIDTSTMLGNVGLAENNKIVVEEYQQSHVTHSERLYVAIEAHLAKAGWQTSQLEGIIAALGPGSFTGLRIGLACAKAFAYSLDIPIVGVSSLAVLAENGKNATGIVVPMIDARRGEIYAEIKNQCEEQAKTPEQWCEYLATFKETLHLYGDGALQYAEIFKTSLGKQVCIAPASEHCPRSAAMLNLGLAKLKEGGTEISQIVPNYIRQSDAEIGFRGNA